MDTREDTRLPKSWMLTDFDSIVIFITDYQANGSFASLKENVRYYKNRNYAVLVRLKDLRQNLNNIDIFVYTDKHGHDFLKKSRLFGGELLVANVGAGVGTTVVMPIINQPATLAPNMFLVIISKYIEKNFFLIYCKSNLFWREVERIAGGSGQPKMNKKEYRSILIPLPPFPEQHRIVARIEQLFTNLDAGVESLKAARTQLKRYRQSVLKSACEGRLVPTEAELARAEGREYEPAEVLLERILEERRWKWEENNRGKKYREPQELNIIKLPNLPEAWKWVRFEQIISLSQNGFGKRRSKEGNPTIVLRLSDVIGGEISLNNVRRIGASNNEIETYKLLKNDILCIRVNGSRNLVGRLIHNKASSELITFCDHFIRFRLVNPIMSYFVSIYFNTERVRKYVENNMVSSAGQNTVSQRTMVAIPIPLPPLAEQHRIVAEVERRLSVADEMEKTIEQSLKQAERLRQSILKRAFEGKLVPQDPEDEPAGVLLERIKEEKEKREAEEKVKKKSKAKGKTTPKSEAGIT